MHPRFFFLAVDCLEKITLYSSPPLLHKSKCLSECVPLSRFRFMPPLTVPSLEENWARGPYKATQSIFNAVVIKPNICLSPNPSLTGWLSLIAEAPFQHGELSQSSYHRSGIWCVRSFVRLRTRRLPSFFPTAAMVNLWHTVDGIFMWVPCSTLFPGSRALLDYSIFNSGLSRLAGNSSLLFTMNGMSSGGIAPTDGQYGSVSFFRASSIVTGTACEW